MQGRLAWATGPRDSMSARDRHQFQHWNGALVPTQGAHVQVGAVYCLHNGMELKRMLPFRANREIQMNQEALDLIYNNLKTDNLLVDGDQEEHMRMKETYKTLYEDQMKLKEKYDLLFEDQQNVYTYKKMYTVDSDTESE
jgi:hypothetical protein